MAESRSEETFVALCLLSVTGASLLTQRMGFSDTLGAFGAGVLLAETNFKTQVGPCMVTVCSMCMEAWWWSALASTRTTDSSPGALSRYSR